MSIIGVFGDVHGAWDDLNCVIQQAIKKYNIDMVIQIGDFGFYPLIFDTYKNLKFSVPVHAIMGNHCDHSFVYKCIKNGEIENWKFKHNIHLIQQGTAWNKDGSKFGFLGKAMNVDRPQKGSTKNRDTNYILNVEVKEALEKFNAVGKLDFLITHSCPHSIGVGMQGRMCFVESVEKYIETPFNISTGPLHDCGEQALTNLWNGLNEKPSHWIYGHFHSNRQANVGTTDFTCVGCVDSLGGHDFTYPYIIDTEKKTFEVFPNDKLFNTAHFKRQKFLEKNDYPI
jgi:hypothetical protein